MSSRDSLRDFDPDRAASPVQALRVEVSGNEAEVSVAPAVTAVASGLTLATCNDCDVTSIGAAVLNPFLPPDL